MNEPRKAGRPAKHLNDDHHFKPAADIEIQDGEILEVVESLTEQLIVKQEIQPVVEVAISSAWHPLDGDIVLTLPPRNGMPISLSETPDGEGTIGFWKRIRAFANPTKRWEETGKWFDFHTGMALGFEPKYWKERF